VKAVIWVVLAVWMGGCASQMAPEPQTEESKCANYQSNVKPYSLDELAAWQECRKIAARKD